MVANGIHTSSSRTTAIQNAPTPRNFQELKSFLGLIHYYGKFVSQLC